MFAHLRGLTSHRSATDREAPDDCTQERRRMMPWFRVDDGFATHRKVLRIPRKDRPSAIGLWTLAGAWCASQGTDGEVPAYILPELAATPRHAQLLVAVGLWTEVPDGYLFHDWLSYQPSAAEVADERRRKHEAKANAGRSGGIASGVARRKHGRSSDEANAKQTEAPGVKQTEAPTRPDPTHPSNRGSDRSSSHLSEVKARKVQGVNVGGQWINTPQVCGQHPDIELNTQGLCRWCEAERKAAS